VHGKDDDLVPEADVAKLAHRLSNQRDIRIDYKTIAGASHFFDEQLDELTSVVDRYLRKAMTQAAAAD
jgi:uncharacterized protein